MMDAVHIFNKMQKFWHAEMTQKFCEAFVGLVFGELLFRFLLLLSNIRILKLKLVCSLTSSKSGQSILNGLMLPFLFAIAFIVFKYSKITELSNQDRFSATLSIAFSLIFARAFMLLNSTWEDITLLEENRYNVGPGLAANFWNSFLRNVITEGDFKLSFDEYVKNTSESIVGKNNSKIECFKRIIILLPEDCTINMNTFEAKECVFKHVPGLCHESVFKEDNRSECPWSHKVNFDDRMSSKVFWIFKNVVDENEFMRSSFQVKSLNSKPKIFVILDFPQLIQSVMGPGEKKGFDKYPEERRKNLRKFKDVVESLVDSNIREHRNEIAFLKIPKSSLRKQKISTLIREKIQKVEMDSFVSGSESEPDV